MTFWIGLVIFISFRDDKATYCAMAGWIYSIAEVMISLSYFSINLPLLALPTCWLKISDTDLWWSSFSEDITRKLTRELNLILEIQSIKKEWPTTSHLILRLATLPYYHKMAITTVSSQTIMLFLIGNFNKIIFMKNVPPPSRAYRGSFEKVEKQKIFCSGNVSLSCFDNQLHVVFVLRSRFNNYWKGKA